MQGWFNIQKSSNVVQHINTLKKKNHMIISVDAGITLVYGKKKKTTLNKLGVLWKLLNLIENIYLKKTANIILNGEKLKTFPLRSGTKQGCPLLLFLFNIEVEVLDNEIR